MNKDDIIKNISMKNTQLEQEVKLWKSSYYTIEKAYQQLLNKYQKTTSSPDKKAMQQTLLQDYFKPSRTITSPQNKKQTKEKQSPPKPKIESKPQIPQQEDIFDFFTSKTFDVPKKVCELIEGCFIIQKISNIDHFDPLRFIYPSQKFDKLKSMFDIIYRYVFIDEKIIEIMDDQFDSRKNQINFGTPSEDFQFVFDNVNEKEGEKGRINQFQKVTHIIRKRYIYGVVRPQLISMNKQTYETQLAYGFISSAPFPNFFKDLNRIVQQQLKFRMLNMNKQIIGKKEKVDIISQILKDFTSKSLEKSLSITSYPINLQLKANVCGLRLVYNNKSSYVSDQFNYIEGFIHKFNLLKLIKIFHYVMTEQHVVLVCKTRKSLNQLFQVIRSIIYPFNWIFPIVYFYSPFFEPFLSSPLPIIIGYIGNEEQSSLPKVSQLPQNDFVTIYAQDNEKDLNQIQSFEKRIKKCYKQYKKDKKEQSQNNISKVSQKSASERLTNKFYSYTKKLRHFIETGKLQQEVDDFHIQFMQTQLASYYKENKN